jgi:hypothetical protein
MNATEKEEFPSFCDVHALSRRILSVAQHRVGTDDEKNCCNNIDVFNSFTAMESTCKSLQHFHATHNEASFGKALKCYKNDLFTL